ncbi:MAG TPA: redoxin domain-containing protein, partial [Thermoanaerobaculia bacterium]
MAGQEPGLNASTTRTPDHSGLRTQDWKGSVMEAGDKAPDVTLEGPAGPVRLLEAAREGPVVLLYFQEASTPTCEAEVRGFVSEHDLVQELGARVL